MEKNRKAAGQIASMTPTQKLRFAAFLDEANWSTDLRKRDQPSGYQARASAFLIAKSAVDELRIGMGPLEVAAIGRAL